MLGLVKAWWAAKEGLESAAEAKRNDIDWSKKNFPFFAPLMHVESDELKNNKEKGILIVRSVIPIYFLIFLTQVALF